MLPQSPTTVSPSVAVVLKAIFLWDFVITHFYIETFCPIGMKGTFVGPFSFLYWSLLALIGTAFRIRLIMIENAWQQTADVDVKPLVFACNCFLPRPVTLSI